MINYINTNDTIFIAGGGGMAGNAIKRSLIKHGYKFLLTPPRKELNLVDFKVVNRWFEEKKPNIVIIAAAKVGGIIANASEPTEFLLENLKIQNNLIEASWRFGVKRLLFLGSSCIYPKYATQPIQEEQLLSGKLEETNQWYSIAKIAGIKLCEALRIQYDFDAISLMPTNLYGPGDNYHSINSHVMASLIKKFYMACKNSHKEVICWGTGEPLREFMHVDDLGEAVVFALESWHLNKNNSPLDQYGKKLSFLNVGSGIEISIKDLAYKIAKLVDYKGTIIWDRSKPNGTTRKLLNSERFMKLGWRPTISLDEGIKNTIESLKIENISKLN